MYDYTDDVIENNEKWFNFFVIAPKVITIVLAVLCGLAGIVMSIAYKSALFLIYFWVGGGIDCLITYVVLKLLLSYRILHVYYLKKIAEREDKTTNRNVSEKKQTFLSEYKEGVVLGSTQTRKPTQQSEQRKNVIINDSVTKIEDCAFFGCTKIETVEMADSVTTIGESAFYFCSRLEHLTLGNGVIRIEGFAFRECASLRSLVVPKSLKHIGEGAFIGCGNLTSIFYKGTPEEWESIYINNTFEGNRNLLNATRYYYSETKPTGTGNYWHYVEGEPTKW